MSDFSKFQTKDLTKPRDKGWGNFAKFEKVGDSVTGIVRDVFYQKAEGQYPERRAFTLEDDKGVFHNVAIKRNPYFAIRPTNDVRLGDLLTVTLSDLKEPSVKGHHKVKIYTFTSGTLPENANNPTVKELEAFDMADQGMAVDGGEEEGGKEEVPFQ